MAGERCAAVGCGRFVGPHARFCGRHAPVNDEPIPLRREARPVLRLVPKESEAQSTETGLAEEIEALRFVLHRLLSEEDDLARLAAGVARIASVVIQAAKAQQALSGNRSDELATALMRALAELDDEATHDVIGDSPSGDGPLPQVGGESERGRWRRAPEGVLRR
jgi:hypothetical protein